MSEVLKKILIEIWSQTINSKILEMKPIQIIWTKLARMPHFIKNEATIFSPQRIDVMSNMSQKPPS